MRCLSSILLTFNGLNDMGYYLPIQKFLKILPRISSVVTSPVIARYAQDFVSLYTNILMNREVFIEGIPRITAESKSFDFLNEEEDLYSVNDLEERYQ